MKDVLEIFDIINQIIAGICLGMGGSDLVLKNSNPTRTLTWFITAGLAHFWLYGIVR